MQSCSKQRLIAVVVDIVGFLALIFQGAGCFLAEWMKYDIEIHIHNTFGPDTSTSQSAKIGLWTVSACVTDRSGFYPQETCATVTIEDLNNAIDRSSNNATMKESQKKFLNDFLPQKILTAFGVFAAFCGLVFTVAYVRSTSKETTGSHVINGISCIICWIISAALVFTAIGIQVNNNAEFVKEVNLIAAAPRLRNILTVHVDPPSAFVVSGMGGAFGILLALVTTLHILLGRNGSGVPARFSNQAI